MDIVCFANDWSGDPLSKKHVMRRLARRHRVLWVDSLGNRAPRVDAHDAGRVLRKLGAFARGVRQVEPNLWVLSPLAVPAYGSSLAAWFNGLLVAATVRLAMRRLGFRHPLLYSFVPASAWVLGQLGERAVVYHCVDEYAAFAGAGAEIAKLEGRLLRRADLVLACSEPLRLRKSLVNPRTLLLRHGVDHAHFARALDERTAVPDDLARLARPGQPIIGFHGLVAEWIDPALVRRVADAHPQAQVILVGELRVGPRELEVLRGAPNVHLLGRKPYAELPGYCKRFDVAILPFTIDELTVHANPLKLREYLSAGLPVVATAIPEAEALSPAVEVARDADEFIRAVTQALAEPRSARIERSRRMASETWDHKVEELESLLASLDDTRRAGGRTIHIAHTG